MTQLALGLDRRRFQPVVYCLGKPPVAPKDALHRQLMAAGVETHFLGISPPWRMLAGVARLARAWRRNPPDLVQTFLFRANIQGALASRLASKSRAVASIRVADPRSRTRLLLERLATRRVERFVCVSRSVADFCRDQAGLPAEKLTVIPNGIDVGRFSNLSPANLAELGVPPGRRAMCVIGRLDRQKNLEWLLKNSQEILAAAPRHDLVIVGDGRQRRRLEKQAAELPLSNRIHFAGWRDDVPQILAACDLLLLPSLWEGMPNVLLEAMAAARPVIATDVEGVREILGSLAPQQVVQAANSKRISERMSAILGNPQLAERLGRENRTRVEHEFPIRAMVEAHQQLYVALLRHTAR